MRHLMSLYKMVTTETIQDQAVVDQIASQIGNVGDDDMPWDDQPAIIVDDTGLIRDGHHRYNAALQAGLSMWPVLTVSAAEWRALCGRVGFVAAARSVCDAHGDAVTWGQAGYQA